MLPARVASRDSLKRSARQAVFDVTHGSDFRLLKLKRLLLARRAIYEGIQI